MEDKLNIIETGYLLNFFNIISIFNNYIICCSRFIWFVDYKIKIIENYIKLINSSEIEILKDVRWHKYYDYLVFFKGFYKQYAKFLKFIYNIITVMKSLNYRFPHSRQDSG